MAVGLYSGVVEGTTVTQPLMESWDGTTWSIDDVPFQGFLTMVLNGVSCTSPSNCVAVGYSEPSGLPRTLIETWNGTSWSLATSPNVPDSQLNGVSCTAPTNCMAVGTGPDGNLIEAWDGTAWSVVPSPDPGINNDVLFGVSCTAPTRCVAVGAADHPVTGGTSGQTLIESWDGTTWTVDANPNPVGGASVLQGVSCTNPTSCIAVGDYFGTTVKQTLVESWDGTAWSLVPSPNQGTTTNVLEGVSCTGPRNCVAVGNNLIESWNGTAWSITPSSNLTGLGGVSCSAASICTAVGGILNAATDVNETLVARGVPVIPVITPGTGSVLEGNSGTTNLRVPVTLSNPSTHTVTAQWKTVFVAGAAGNQADPASDYSASSGTVTFAPGSTTANVTIAVNGDTLVERDEYIIVQFGSPTNGTIGGSYGLGEGVITNDDRPAVVPGTASVLEGNSGTTDLQVPVTLSQPSPETVTAQWRTVFVSGAGGNQADPASDYSPASGTVTFVPGSTTANVMIAVSGDTLVEPDEYIVVQFGSATNATIGGFYGLGQGVITNDD
jgi:hypothetical protein